MLILYISLDTSVHCQPMVVGYFFLYQIPLNLEQWQVFAYHPSFNVLSVNSRQFDWPVWYFLRLFRWVVCVSVYVSVCLYLCLYVCLSVCLSFCLSAYLSVCLSVRPSVRLSVRPSVCMSVRPNVHPSVCLSVRRNWLKCERRQQFATYAAGQSVTLCYFQWYCGCVSGLCSLSFFICERDLSKRMDRLLQKSKEAQS